MTNYSGEFFWEGRVGEKERGLAFGADIWVGCGRWADIIFTSWPTCWAVKPRCERQRGWGWLKWANTRAFSGQYMPKEISLTCPIKLAMCRLSLSLSLSLCVCVCLREKIVCLFYEFYGGQSQECPSKKSLRNGQTIADHFKIF